MLKQNSISALKFIIHFHIIISVLRKCFGLENEKYTLLAKQRVVLSNITQVGVFIDTLCSDLL